MRDGNIDVADLASQGRRSTRAIWRALMVTYPSTHGVFEAAIKDICAIDPRGTADRFTWTART
jgi:glycine dehydrogenase